MWLATVLLSGFVTLAFGTVTVLALCNCSKAGRMRKQIGKVLRHLGDRRTGKRTLERLREPMKTAPQWLQMIYAIRLEAVQMEMSK